MSCAKAVSTGTHSSIAAAVSSIIGALTAARQGRFVPQKLVERGLFGRTEIILISPGRTAFLAGPLL
jgi:hypothetical protein